MSLIDDPAEFFDLDGIAEAAMINGVEVAVIFDKREVVSSDMISEKPVLLMPTADTVGVSFGDDVLVRNRNYTIDHWLSDGDGFTTIVLNEAI